MKEILDDSLKLESALTCGWSAKPLGQIGPLQRGFDLPSRQIRPGSVPIVYSNGVTGFHARAMAPGPGVVTGRSGTIGKVHFIESPFWPHNTSLWVTRFNGNDPKFVFYLYDFVGFERFASGSGVPTLNRNDAHLYCVAIPDAIAEQRAIAKALSDVDALLTGLDRLIAKKRDIKQAAMQQLLTGQTRLPGFQGEWEVKRLGDLAEMGSGGTPTSSVTAFYGGGIPWVSIADMTRAGREIASTEKTLTALGVERSAAQLFPAGTILYAMYASLGECCIAGVPVTTSQAILGIRPRQHLIAEFLYYVLIAMKGAVRSLGQHGTQANLNKSIVQGFEINLPPREEQLAIATVLSDMDAELAALEARRDKTRALKQGMMQELLTGKTRLVKPETAHV